MAALFANTHLRRYRLCDFTLEAELELPELASATPDATGAEVFVRWGQMPRGLTEARERGACFMAQPGELLCWLEGVASFHVRNGCEIVVERDPNASMDAVRGLLFSSPLAGLLLQRGCLPLHGSAVATPFGALVFTGSAAVGKSTLAAEFRRRGFGVLSDVVTALRVTDHDGGIVLPVSECLRLWPDSIAATDERVQGVALRRGVDKRLVLGSGSYLFVAAPLAGVFCLERGELQLGGAACVRLTGAGAVAALLEAVYRPAFVRGLGEERTAFGQLAILARSTRVVRLVVPADRLAPSETVERILEDLA